MTTQDAAERLGDRLEVMKQKGLIREDILERFKEKKAQKADALGNPLRQTSLKST